LMLGKSGTTVNFSVKRTGQNGFETIDFSIERRAVVEETVTFSLHDNNVGIVRISQFDKGTFAQFENAINNLTAQGADRFVFDLRYNPGGDLNAITQVLDMLLPEGPIIRYADKFGKEAVINSDAECIDYPFAVIVNGSTASAGELFAAALKDYEKATVVGEKTFGKGTMQSVFELDDGSAVCMTIGKYYPPYSDGYDGQGVIPHESVTIAEEYKNISIYKLTYEQDDQLQKAVEAVKK
ncbi:MAG: S41 family peptidase, partial [Clostridia bacterium]|nr:S41 family peptidase [Clostridia bacterium]